MGRIAAPAVIQHSIEFVFPGTLAGMAELHARAVSLGVPNNAVFGLVDTSHNTDGTRTFDSQSRAWLTLTWTTPAEPLPQAAQR